MLDLKYTITNFDANTSTLTVEFAEGGWASIRLATPLPQNIEELSTIIKQFAQPVEAIQAQTEPDADLSYIDNLIGIEQTTERYSIEAVTSQNAPEVDPEIDAALKAAEELQFKQRVANVLVKFGVLTSDQEI